MKRLVLGLSVVSILVLAVWSRNGSTQPVHENGKEIQKDVIIEVKPLNPWNNLKFNNEPGVFRFAIVTDRTGGARKGVFELAVDQLNTLQPEFVVSVGDLIEGSGKDAPKLEEEWKQFNGWIDKLKMPFFYLPGNHDYGNALMEKYWHNQFGRSFYHFVYKNVLFLMLNTEEAPRPAAGVFSKEQLAYVKKTLEANSKVRWTLVFMHKPVWTYKEVEKTGLPEIEAGLKGHKYTVFAGHKHVYQKFDRNGMKYYMLATTGGTSKLRGTKEGEFDHLVWVTMKDNGPVLTNLMMSGIFPEDVRHAPPYVSNLPMPKPKEEKKNP